MLIMAWNRLLAAFLAATSLCSVASAGHYLPDPLQDQDFAAASELKIELGKQLFFDKILSGNLNISCATCHHPFAGTGDGLSLSVGEGARGTGVARDTGTGLDAVHERVPRNAPAIFNLGALEFTTLFHDGRIQPDPDSPGGIASPAGTQLPFGLDNALAAQAMFPVTSGTEMAGQPGENPIADAAASGMLAGPDGVWEQLAERLRGIDGYVTQFIAAFDDISDAQDIRLVHAANAIAAFEAVAWRSPGARMTVHSIDSCGARGMRSAASRCRGCTCFMAGPGVAAATVAHCRPITLSARSRCRRSDQAKATAHRGTRISGENGLRVILRTAIVSASRACAILR